MTDTDTDAIAAHYRALLSSIGEDPQRDGLLHTPQRAAKALHYLTQGYRQNLDNVVGGAIFKSDNDQMVTSSRSSANATSPICRPARSSASPNSRASPTCIRGGCKFRRT